MISDTAKNDRVHWLAAVLAALAGSALLYDARLGLNWFIWIAAAAVAVAASRFAFRGRVEVPLAILLGWATLLSLGAAINASPFFQLLMILSDAMLLGLAVVVIGAERWRTLSATLLATVPFLAPARVLRGTFQDVVRLPESISALRNRPVARGIIIAAPLALILLALLRDADPVIAWVWRAIDSLLPDWSISGRVIFFFFLLALTLGAASLAAHQRDVMLPHIPVARLSGRLGTTEQKTILITLNVVMWIFLALQLSYAIHPPPAAVGNGMTFAEYARRGFGELSIAVTLVGAVLILLGRRRTSDGEARDKGTLQRVRTFLLIALELVLVSAFRRVILYEQAYGFTTARLYAQAYMIAMAIAIAVLWVELRQEELTVDLGRRIAVVGLATLTVLVFWNHEAWILNRNLDRSHTTGEFDAGYLSQLSANAVPAALSRRAEFPADQHAFVEQWAACHVPAKDLRWFEYNARLVAAKHAVIASGLRCDHPSLKLSTKPAGPSPKVSGPAQSQ